MVVAAGLVALWALAGATLAVRRREERLGRLALGIAVVTGAGLLASAVDGGTGAAGVDVADAAARMALALVPALALHLLAALPDGRLHGRGRVLVAAGYAVAAATGAGLVAVAPAMPRWPVSVLLVLAVVSGLAPASRRYRRASAVERRRLQWVGWGASVAAELVLVVVALEVLADWPHHVAAISLASTGLLPLSLIAGTSPRLLAHVDRLLTHTVALAGLTALVVGVYVVAVLGLGRAPQDDERGVLLLSMAAAAVAALLYLPARHRLTTFANGLVYGEQAAPDDALRTFGSRLTRAIPLDELLLQLVESLRRSFGLAAAEIWTGSAGHLELSASVPHRSRTTLELRAGDASVVARAGVSGGTWLSVWLPSLVVGRDPALVRVAPVAHGGELLGLIVLERVEGSEVLTDDDDAVLVELARQVGLALHNVQLDSALQDSLEELRRANEELRRSRARIVAAGDAERRRLERDLHDGAQQHLVALAVKIRLARDAVEDDPADAVAMLDELKGDVQEAVAELRALAHGIFPKLLVSEGLAVALAAAAGRAGLPTTVDVDGVGRYAPELEAAVYFCCLEALQNAGKHAGDGAVATVRAWESDGTLHFEVADDGAGFDTADAAADGHGFVNMADRLGAIDGSLCVESAPGRGTRVAGAVPVGGAGGVSR